MAIRTVGDWVQAASVSKVWHGALVAQFTPTVYASSWRARVTMPDGGLVAELAGTLSPPGTPGGLAYGVSWNGRDAGGNVVAFEGVTYVLTVELLEEAAPAGNGDADNGNGADPTPSPGVPLWVKVAGVVALSVLTR